MFLCSPQPNSLDLEVAQTRPKPVMTARKNFARLRKDCGLTSRQLESYQKRGKSVNPGFFNNFNTFKTFNVFSYEARQELRPPVIQELTEEEDEMIPDPPEAQQMSSDTLPPPPTLGELQASQEMMTPVKNGDQVLSDRKVRTITQV